MTYDQSQKKPMGLWVSNLLLGATRPIPLTFMKKLIAHLANNYPSVVPLNCFLRRFFFKKENFNNSHQFLSTGGDPFFSPFQQQKPPIWREKIDSPVVYIYFPENVDW